MNTKKLGIFFLLVAACLGFQGTSVHAEPSTSGETPVILKMNDYYVLYTEPKAPYVDSHNRMIVPLRSVSELLGAQVDYDVTAKTATLSQDNHTVVLTANSHTAIVDGKTVIMDTQAIEDKGYMFVPLRILIDSFHITASIGMGGVVELSGSHLLREGKLKYFMDNDFGNRRLMNAHAFLPLSYSFQTYKERYLNQVVTIKSKNISGQDIPKGYEDEHIMFVLGGVTGQEDEGPLGNRARPPVKKDAIVTRSANAGPDHISFILFAGRTIMPHPQELTM